MNRKMLIIPLLFLIIFCISACGTKKEAKTDDSGKIRITASIFPAFDWTRNILGENPAEIELSLLVNNGVDLHSYQPSVEDILKITNSDLFIYTGGESDQWVTEALNQPRNPNLHVLKMIDVLGDAAKTEETVEGMQQEEHEAEEQEDEYDEHIWLSLRNAAVIAEAVKDELSALDPQNADVYAANLKTYSEKLSALDDLYTKTISDAPIKTLLFGDRFPFRYLVDDYGLEYYAAFSGCSAETEASFDTITFLAQKCDELELPVVLTIDGTDHRIADTIVNNTRSKAQSILTLDSMQSVTKKEIDNGTNYISIMENNLEILKQALGKDGH